jgi:hypothetical protein
VLGHALQCHRCRQIQSGNVFDFAAVFYLATEFLYLWVSPHFQELVSEERSITEQISGLYSPELHQFPLTVVVRASLIKGSDKSFAAA